MTGCPARGYRAYGCRIRSQGFPLPLPLWPADGDEAPEIDLHFAGESPDGSAGQIAWPPPGSQRKTAFRVFRCPDRRLRLHLDASPFDLPEWFEFLIGADGRAIRIAWSAANTPITDILPYLLNAGLAAAVRLQGRLCLHGNGMASGGRGFAVLGEQGRGKSSLANALIDQGARLAGDDIVPLTESPCELRMESLFPRLRLCPQVAAARFGSAQALPAVWPDRPYPLNKRYRELDAAQFEPGPVPLCAIYVLGRRSPATAEPEFTRLDPMTACLALSQNRYADWAVAPERRGVELAQLADLSRRLPVYRVALPDQLQRLPDSARQLLRHFERPC